MAKQNKQYVYYLSGKKNLRRINIVVTAQTLQHLEAMAAANGWGEKDLGRVVDKLMRTVLSEQNTSSQKCTYKGE